MHEMAQGNTYAFLKNQKTEVWSIQRVDHYAPLLRDSTTRDISTSLKIVPCRMRDTLPDETSDYTIIYGLPTLVTSDPYCTGDNIYSINDTINEGSSTTTTSSGSNEKPDYIEVALVDANTYAAPCPNDYEVPGTNITPGTYSGLYLPIPFAVMVQHNLDSNLLEIFSGQNYRGNPAPPDVGPFALGAKDTFMEIKNAGGAITTRIEHQFKFIARQSIDITSTFIIRSRPYVCHKLEYTIQPDRVDPLVTGYFYELNQ